MFGVIPQLGSSRLKPLPHWPDSGRVSIATLEETVPKFTVATLINYFVLREVHHDKTASDFSSVSDKAYRLFFKGHVQKLEANSVARETFPCKPSKRMFYVRAKVHPKMKQKSMCVWQRLLNKELVKRKVLSSHGLSVVVLREERLTEAVSTWRQ